jgi:biopolymer transport protein TolR
MKTSSEEPTAMNEINVTPFVDVMLVLLIIFMVAAPLLHYGLEVDLPESSRQPLDIPQEQIVLSIRKDKTIHLDRYEVPLPELEARLKAVFAGRTDREIFLQADRSIPYGYVVKTMAVIRAAGIDRMGLITEPPD